MVISLENISKFYNGNQILKNDPTKKVLYVTSEIFTNEFIDSITNKNNSEFIKKYREIDVLLI